MKLVMKNIWNGWKIVDEQEEVIGYIKRKAVGRQIEIQDKTSVPVYRVEQQEKRLSVYEGNKQVASGTLLYETDEAGTVIRKSLVRPPAPLFLELKWDLNSYTLEQKPHRDVTISQGGELIGSIEQILSLTHHQATSRGTISSLVLAALDVLAYFMVHDDDVDIV